MTENTKAGSKQDEIMVEICFKSVYCLTYAVNYSMLKTNVKQINKYLVPFNIVPL